MSEHERTQPPQVGLGELAGDDATIDSAHLQIAARDSLAADESSSSSAAEAVQLDHFQLIEQIGQGGMGTVYRARDTTLRRDVAIKVLLENHKEAAVKWQGRHRFLDEARITGQLQHPGIPPVHQLGTLADGRPFLAMKLVKGHTLQELLKDRRDPAQDRSRFVAIFEQICHAIGYAHTHRVIHRDLKPGNVMVGAHGEVQVMDWGLAKVLVDSPEEEPEPGETNDQGPLTVDLASKIDTADRGDSATRTGQTLGTPAYMAPEQAGGEIRKLDERCDVFGLGAILCAILTGEPPYVGTSVHDVLMQAIRGDLGDAQRRLDACVGEPELVDLCRRCLAFDKAERPADGKAVAAEVTRIREDAELRARQAELEKAEALVREAEQRKRRRQVLAAAAAIVLVLAIGAAGTTMGMWRAEAARGEAEAARQEAIRRREEALAERDAKAKALAAEREAKELEREARVQAMTALRFMTDDAIKDQLASGKSYLPASKKRYLEKVIEFYEGFAKLRGEREEVRAIRAEGYFRVGKLENYVGEPKLAHENMQKAVQLYRELVAEYPGNANYRHELVRSLNVLVSVAARRTGDYAEAERLAKEAIEAGKQLVGAHPEEGAYANVLAETHRILGLIFNATSRYPAAEAELEQAIAIGKRLARQFPEAADGASNLAASHHNLALVYENTGRYAEAEDNYNKAIEVYQQLTRRLPEVTEYRSGMALSHYNLAAVYDSMGRYADAEAEVQKAIGIYEQLARQFPEVPEYRSNLAGTHNNLAIVYQRTSRYGEAEAEYKKAIEIRSQLTQQFPEVPKYRSNLASTHNNLAVVYQGMGRYAEGEDEYKKAIEAREQLAQRFPEVPEYRSNLAGTHNNLAIVYQSTGRYAKAEEEHKKAIEIYEQLDRQFPKVPRYRAYLANAYIARGLSCLRANRRRDAEKSMRRGVEIFSQLVEQFPDAADHRGRLAYGHFLLGTIYSGASRYAQAEPEYEKAITHYREFVKRYPNAVTDKSLLAAAHNKLGNVMLKTHKPSDAEPHAREAMRLRRELAAKFPGEERYWTDLGRSEYLLSRTLVQTKRYEEARKLCDDGLGECENLLAEHPDTQVGRLQLLLIARVVTLAALNDRDGAMQAARRLASLEHDPKGVAHNAACALSLAAQAVTGIDQLEPQQRRDSAEFFAREAVAMLQTAIRLGYDNIGQIRTDSDLDPIRDRDDFKKVVAELEAKLAAEKSAKGDGEQ